MAEEVKRRKICIAIHGLAHAGAERVAATWANYLADQGHDVFVMVYAHGSDDYSLNEKVRVIPLADSSEAYFGMNKVKQLLSIRKVIAREKPQQIVSFLPKMQISVMLATLGMRLKRIETVRNNAWTDKDVEGKRFLWNLCFRRSDLILVQTKEQALYFPETLQRKAVVISNPISDGFASVKKEYGDCAVRKFIAVARINPQKNYPLMIRAFARAAEKYPECTLDIYGNGTPEAVQKLEELIKQQGMRDNIRLRGWVRDIPAQLVQYDAFLMSSDYEGMPNALAEAMATGLVCLSTDCKTGPKDMIDPGVNGYLATTGSVDSFSEGIQKIIQMDPEQCAEMGAAAREKILTMCSEENTLARLKQLIEDM